MIELTPLATALQALFGATADALACELGVVRRRRVFTGGALVRTLVFGWMHRPDAAPHQLAAMAARCGAPVTPQALRRRFTPALNRLLERLLELAATQLVAGPPRAAALLGRFAAVTLLDSTVVALPPAHRGRWPGCGGNASAAALKVQVRWDLLRGSLRGLLLEPGRRPDAATPLAGAAGLPAGSIRVADLGYFDVAALAALAAAGVHFLTRIQPATAIFDEAGGRLDLWAWLGRHREPAVERAIGLGAGHRLPCRLLAWRCPAAVVRKRLRRLRRDAQRKGRPVGAAAERACRWTVLVTDAPAATLAAEEARALYGARWQVELLFKLWKGGNRLTRPGVAGGDPERALAEVYAKLLGAIVQHWAVLHAGWEGADFSVVKAARWVRQAVPELARAVSRGRWEQLEELLADLKLELAKVARIAPRKKRPGTFQTLAGKPCAATAPS